MSKHDLNHIKERWRDFTTHLYLGKYDNSIKATMLTVGILTLVGAFAWSTM